jgi:hypothetical protein
MPNTVAMEWAWIIIAVLSFIPIYALVAWSVRGVDVGGDF